MLSANCQMLRISADQSEDSDRGLFAGLELASLTQEGA
jgi:hypothetical protein